MEKNQSGGMMSDFMECSVCRSKLGSPVLCESCLHNRSAIASLQKYKEWFYDNSTRPFEDEVVAYLDDASGKKGR